MSLVTGSMLPRNFWRWAAALGLGFFAGVFTAVADSPMFPGWYTLFRDGIVEMIPCVVALRMTLTKGSAPAAK